MLAGGSQCTTHRTHALSIPCRQWSMGSCGAVGCTQQPGRPRDRGSASCGMPTGTPLPNGLTIPNAIVATTKLMAPSVQSHWICTGRKKRGTGEVAHGFGTV